MIGSFLTADLINIINDTVTHLLVMDNLNTFRRKFLAFGATAAGLSLFSPSLFAAVKTEVMSDHRQRQLNIHAVNLNEQITTTYFDTRGYIRSELSKLNYLLRDRRSQEVAAINPKVLDQLYILQKFFGFERRIMMVCGYRSALTNASMRKKSRGVAKKSLHMTGDAIDFYIEGVDLTLVREAALSLKLGGVGYYPSSNFIHVDTGPIRAWS